MFDAFCLFGRFTCNSVFSGKKRTGTHTRSYGRASGDKSYRHPHYEGFSNASGHRYSDSDTYINPHTETDKTGDAHSGRKQMGGNMGLGTAHSR